MKRFALLMVVVACLSLTAFAQDVPAGDVFGGFSVAHSPNYTSYGWQASAASNVNSMLGIVGDFGGQYKNSVSSYQYLFGPRVNARGEKVNYFAHALFGGVHSTGSNGFAMGFGGGVDVKVGERHLIRVLQFDWIPTHYSGGWTSNSTRFGFGVVMNFGSK